MLDKRSYRSDCYVVAMILPKITNKKIFSYSDNFYRQVERVLGRSREISEPYFVHTKGGDQLVAVDVYVNKSQFTRSGRFFVLVANEFHDMTEWAISNITDLHQKLKTEKPGSKDKFEAGY